MTPLTDDEDDAQEASLFLVFTVGGQAILEEGNDDEREVIWASDDDEDFREEFQNEYLGQADAEKILNYLVRAGDIEDDEKENVILEIEDDDSVVATN